MVQQQAVCLTLSFLKGWTRPHWSPRPVGIHRIPSSSLAPRVPSGWYKLEAAAAAGGVQVAILASTSLSSSPCLLGSTWDLFDVSLFQAALFFNEEKNNLCLYFTVKTPTYQECVGRSRRRMRRSRGMVRIGGASGGG